MTGTRQIIKAIMLAVAWLPLCGAVHLYARPAMTFPDGPRPTAGRLLPEAVPETTAHALYWHDELNSAMSQAAISYRPVLLFATAPGCVYCRQMKARVLSDPELRPFLEKYVLAEIDITAHPRVTAMYQIQGVPAFYILDSEGRATSYAMGFIPIENFRQMLQRHLEVEITLPPESMAARVQTVLDHEEIAPGDWPLLLSALRDDRLRESIRRRVLSTVPFPSSIMIEMLQDSRLTVRLGALEILEEHSGHSMFFDPWLPPDADDNLVALEQWHAWADGNGTVAVTRSTLLSVNDMERYLQDLLDDDRDRSMRARRMLVPGGAPAAGFIEAFLDSTPVLREGHRRRCREILYAIRLPPIANMEPLTVANRLVFGTIDVQLDMLRNLKDSGPAALFVAEDFMRHDDAVARETAVELFFNLTGISSLPKIEAMLARETDRDVLVAVALGLGTWQHPSALPLLQNLAQEEREEVVIAALQGLARTLSRRASETVMQALRDPRWRVRVEAVDAAQRLKLNDDPDAIRALLKDDDAFVRFKTVEAVTSIFSDQSLTWLNEAFRSDESLRAPVLGAYCAVSRPLPKEFIEILLNSDIDTLLAALQVGRECETTALDFILQAARHENDDVACTALRMLGRFCTDKPEAKALVGAALESGAVARIHAALVSVEEYLRRRGRSVQRDTWLDIDALINKIGENLIVPIETTRQDSVEELTEAPAAGSPLHDLFASFEPPTVQQPASQEIAKKQETETGTAKPGLGSLFDAFESAAPAPTTAPRKTGIPARFTDEQLHTTLLELTNHGDEHINYRSRLLLLQMGAEEPLEWLSEKPALTIAQRVEVATALEKISARPALLQTARMLDDPDSQVRNAAAGSLRGRWSEQEAVSAVFDRLLDPSAPLSPPEVFDHNFISTLNNIATQGRSSAIRPLLLDYAGRMLQNSDPRLRTMGVHICALIHEASMDEQIVKATADDNPWVRRAAWQALLKNRPELAAGNHQKMLKETMPEVQTVLAEAIAFTERSRRQMYHLDASHVTSRYEYSRQDQFLRFPRETREALLDMLADIFEQAPPAVAFPAGLRLIERNRQVSAARFLQTARMLPDQKVVRQQVMDMLAHHYRRLGRQWSPLVDYLQLEHREDHQHLLRHFEVTVYSETFDPTAVTEVDTNDQSEKSPEDENIWVVFFEEPGCPACHEVEDWLYLLRSQIPGIMVVRHNIIHIESRRLNEAVCDHFKMPAADYGRIPAVFTGIGGVTGEDVNYDSLAQLIIGAAGIPLTAWLPEVSPATAPVAAADTDQSKEPPGTISEISGLLPVIILSVLIGIIWGAFSIKKK